MKKSLKLDFYNFIPDSVFVWGGISKILPVNSLFGLKLVLNAFCSNGVLWTWGAGSWTTGCSTLGASTVGVTGVDCAIVWVTSSLATSCLISFFLIISKISSNSTPNCWTCNCRS